MWNAKQRAIALVGTGLIVLACLFPPVWRTGLCDVQFTYIFAGNYSILNAAPDRSTDIAWLPLLLQLATVGMAMGGLILRNRSEKFVSMQQLKSSLKFACITALYQRLSPPVRVILLLAIVLLLSESVPTIRRVISSIQHPPQHRDLLNQELFFAVKSQDLPLATKLLDQGADSNTYRSAEVHMCVGETSHPKGEIFKETYTPTCEIVSDKTVLGLAVEQGNLPLVKLLIERGADIHRRHRTFGGGGQNSLLTIAVNSGNREVATYLLTHGLTISGDADSR